MAYTTIANVKLNIDIEGYQVEDAEITFFITKSDSIIDSMISSLYSLPLDSTPDVLISISTDLASYFIFRKNYSHDRIEKMENSLIYDFYNKAMSLLKKISSGEISLGSDFPQEPIAVSNTGDYPPTFNVDDETKVAVSEKRLADVNAERD